MLVRKIWVCSMVEMTLAATFGAMLLLYACSAGAQESEEVASLKAQIELLTKENELLKKEIDPLKREGKAAPHGRGAKTGAKSLSELITDGKVFEGTYRALQGDGHGEVTITIAEREGSKFKGTFLLEQKDKENKNVGTSEGNIEGLLDGARLSWKSVGSATKINAIVMLKGDGLEGTYKTQAGISGTIGFRVK